LDGLGTVYVSGQLAFIPGTRTIDGTTAPQQAKRALQNMSAILKAAGSGMDRVVKTTIMLADMNDFASVNEVYAQAFGNHLPARACFGVNLPPGVLIEIDAIALEK